MKKLVFILLLCNYFVNAQDTLRFRNGTTVAVKVSEIGTTEIKYNRFDNVNGPQYIVEKNDIQLIKYSNGHIDTFAVVKPQIDKRTTEQAKGPTVNYFTTTCEKLEIDAKNKILCNKRSLSENKIHHIIYDLPGSEKKTKLINLHKEMRYYQKRQYQYGFGGLVVLLAAPYIGAIASIGSESAAPIAAGFVIGGAAAIVGSVISKEFKMKRMAKRRQIVDVYNQ